MPKPPYVQERSRITDLILLHIVQHGGEWPDWGDTIKIGMIAQLAGSLKNKTVGKQIVNVAQKGIGG